MGWWSSDQLGGIIGDEPLDTLGDAVARVVRQYEAAHGRRPTIAEWEALLRRALGHEQDEYRCAGDGVPAEVRITPRA